ncbi:MAG TPA: helix-turn-helix domain-containing protein [Candidatus Cloacimonadota bacterium]|nr:helix-turn-helix domain-containing protein [Candidatus Cloacimonadota bacterium]
MVEKLIAELAGLGLNELEAKIYIILLQKQFYTASELSKTAKINRTQVYDILSNLIQKGVCTEVLGSVKKYSAVDPETVIDNFRKELISTQKTIDKLAPTLINLFKNNVENENPLDFVKVLRTNKNIYENVMQLVRSARESILVFNKPPYAMIPDRNEEEISSLQKGVINKCVYEFEPGNADEFSKRLQYFAQAGEQIRIVPDLPMKMILVDSKFVVFNMKHNGFSGTQFTAMMIENSDLARLLIKTFEVYWNEGYSLEILSEKIKKEC